MPHSMSTYLAAQLDSSGKLTWTVALVCLLASSGGLLFGYDVGVTGGVTSMPAFLDKFFPQVRPAQRAHSGGAGAYCQYNDPLLQLFTSSLYLAGIAGGFAAGPITRRSGRTGTMLAAGALYAAGAALLGGAASLAMLVVGRVALGLGTGLANQAVPLYLSEMAPARLRGACNSMFQLSVAVGIVTAELVNVGTGRAGVWGWRLSLALAGVPAAALALGGALLPDTPNSLVQRGRPAEAERVLRRARGIANVAAELSDIQAAAEVAAKLPNPWHTLLQRHHRPELVMALAIPFFQQITGINSVIFYAPLIFKSVGAGDGLAAAAATGLVALAGTGMALLTVDRFGRKVLLIQGGVQMIAAEVAVAALMGVEFGGATAVAMSRGAAVALVAAVCVFVAGFSWSWGPLGWLIPSEVQPLATRSAGQSLAVAVNFAATFAVGQSLLAMLCAMRYGIYLFFAAWVLAMTIFVALFLPETAGIPIERIREEWARHWFWSRYVTPADVPPPLQPLPPAAA